MIRELYIKFRHLIGNFYPYKKEDLPTSNNILQDILEKQRDILEELKQNKETQQIKEENVNEIKDVVDDIKDQQKVILEGVAKLDKIDTNIEELSFATSKAHKEMIKKLNQNLVLGLMNFNKLLGRKDITIEEKQLHIEMGYKDSKSIKDWVIKMQEKAKENIELSALINILTKVLSTYKETIKDLNQLAEEEDLVKYFLEKEEGREIIILLLIKNIIRAKPTDHIYSYLNFMHFIGGQLLVDLKLLVRENIFNESKADKEHILLELSLSEREKKPIALKNKRKRRAIKELLHYLIRLEYLSLILSRKKDSIYWKQRNHYFPARVEINFNKDIEILFTASLLNTYNKEDKNRYPLISSPDPWKAGVKGGGYLLNKKLKLDHLIHAKDNFGCNVNEEDLSDELYQIINYLQKMPFHINTRVTGYYNNLIKEENPALFTIFPWFTSLEASTDKDKMILIKKQLSENRFHALLLSNILEEQGASFYNAVFLDARLRAYFISLLSPQNEDFIKALIVSNKKLRLKRIGAKEMVIYGGSLRKDQSKLSREEKYNYILKNRLSLKKEFSNKMTLPDVIGDKLFQYIAWFLEMDDLGFFKEDINIKIILKLMEKKETKYLISLDTLASNVTNSSLLFGTDRFSKELKLEKIVDQADTIELYSSFLEKGKKLLREKNIAETLLSILPRKVFKMVSMIYLYNAGFAKREETMTEILDITYKEGDFKDITEKVEFYNAVNETIEHLLVTEFVEFNTFRNDIKANLPRDGHLEWCFGDSISIKQYYAKYESKRESFKTGDKFTKLRLIEHNLDDLNLNKEKTLSSTIANIFHTIDATILRLVVSALKVKLEATKEQHSFMVNHDAYFIHPSQAFTLKNCYKEVLITVFSEANLEKFAISLNLAANYFARTAEVRKKILAKLETSDELLS